MSIEAIKTTAQRCCHFGLCKVDFLGTGVCPSGKKSLYVAYFPEGRMEIAHSLAKNILPVTERLVDIAQSCSLCGICEKQCYFVNEINPMEVMRALKEHVESHLKENKPVIRPKEDRVLKKLKAVVGDEWASNDPAILMAYSRDNNPFVERVIPRYVVMAGSKQEVAKIVKIANKNKIPYTPRSSGGSGHGLALGNGIIIDFQRMKKVQVDTTAWCATVEPGVNAFEIQQEAAKHGMRASVAEVNAGVCSNILTTRLNTLFSHAYGSGLDYLIDAEFVNIDGKPFTLNDPEGSRLLNFKRETVFKPDSVAPPRPICTQAIVKLFPKMNDEEGIVIPFEELQEASEMVRELGRRRIGYGAGVISMEYASAFLSSTIKNANEFKKIFMEKLKVNYWVIVLGDKYAIETVKNMSEVYIDKKMFRTVVFSISKLNGHEGINLLPELSGNKRPYEVFFKEEMYPLIEVTLDPEPQDIARDVDDPLKDFFIQLYSRPEMTDIMWINMYRFISTRLSREKHYMAFIFYISLNDSGVIADLAGKFKAIGDKYGLKNDFGYHNSIDLGKWAVVEYDFWYDITDEIEKKKALKAFLESREMFTRYLSEKKVKGFASAKQLWQGQCRFESLAYPRVS